MRLTLSDLPPAFRAQAAQQLGLPKDRRPRRTSVVCLPEPVKPGAERFEILMPGWMPVLVNELLQSRWNGAKRKKQDANTLAWACKEAGVTRADVRRCVSAIVTMPPRRRCPDGDSFNKSLRDGLVHCGALRDDSPKWCTGTEPEFVRGEKLSLRIVLEDA